MLFKITAIVLLGVCSTLASDTGPWYKLWLYHDFDYRGSHEMHHGGLPVDGGFWDDKGCAHCMDHNQTAAHLGSFKYTVGGANPDVVILLKFFSKTNCYDEYPNEFSPQSVPVVTDHALEVSRSHKVCWSYP
ncbi:hypothetical protein BV22DRAFT_214809 [Leucogyrophana mollusca]|uniref:Uncharacterized protein n=1 Tax=Leucogyrophana mollusca TaxID=85980 RepID=A0ACB8BT86_9AGAM|nr:hypothetical protein BV22DRAFT_214809 [Leucogyrophana mollusca]